VGEFTYLYRYDINKKDKFEKLFGDLYIGKNPTEERNSFLIWKISFAGVDAGNGEEGLRKSFNEKVILSVEKFVSYYSDLLQDKVVSKDIKSAGILHGEGFVKVFYKALKDATTDNFGRIFMTGVSPIMLDDLTSGFNITRNYTLDENLNAMLGFTRAELSWIMEKVDLQETELKNRIRKDMTEYYNGYKFNENGESVFNPDMALYFLDGYLAYNHYPKEMIDNNVKTDYGKVNQLAYNKGSWSSWNCTEDT